MSNTIIGSLAGGVLAPGATVSYNTDGTIVAAARYQYLQGATPSVIGNAHPDQSAAQCVSYTLTFDEVFQYADLHYTGLWSTSAVHVDVQSGLQANPIETHPNFVSTLGGSPGSALNGAVFDSNGLFLGWPANAPLNLGGVRVYLAAANTHRFTKCTSSNSTIVSEIANIGQIASSLTSAGMTVTQTNGFMLQNVTIDWDYVGGITPVYRYTEIWVSTQPPGWNTNIYPP